jgi:hypothetical protein
MASHAAQRKRRGLAGNSFSEASTEGSNTAQGKEAGHARKSLKVSHTAS